MHLLTSISESASHGATGTFSNHVELPRIANESTHYVATALLDAVKWILSWFGLENNSSMVSFCYAALVIVIAFLIGAGVKWLAIAIARKISEVTNNSLMKDMRQANFFSKARRIIPPAVILILIQFAFVTDDTFIHILNKAMWIYITIVFAISINSMIYVLWIHIDNKENTKRLPLQGIIQLIKGIIWIVAIVVSVCIIVDKSPATLLAGLGAFAAVLSLIFKDSILGLVAGVQLAENDMLREGDWIAVQGTNANGTVIGVNLTSVKVLNWDKTVTTVPPYNLVSAPFTNYRSMQLSNTRQIQRVYLLDADTVQTLTPEDLEELKKIPLLTDYITIKQRQAAEGKVENVFNSDKLVDGTIDTNLGLFRAYVKLYLDQHPHVSHEDICFVKTKEQTASGIPLQIYCFTNTSSWAPYESIQSAIFEHIAVMLQKFNLYVFENPSGRDSVNEGYLESGKDSSKIYGLPYPFMVDVPQPAPSNYSDPAKRGKPSPPTT